MDAHGDTAGRALILSRFASVLGIATLSYGAIIYLATIGAPQFTISLMGATRYLAALLVARRWSLPLSSA